MAPAHHVKIAGVCTWGVAQTISSLVVETDGSSQEATHRVPRTDPKLQQTVIPRIPVQNR